MSESEVIHAERHEQRSLRDAEAYTTRLVGQRRMAVEDWPDAREVEQ